MGRPTVTNAFPDADEITIRTSDAEIDISRQENGDIVITVEYGGSGTIRKYILGEATDVDTEDE